MYFHSETALFNACRTLFGKDVTLSHEFLDYLQPSGAKAAFRCQAKVHHPDAYANSSTQICKQQTERFREIHQAYKLVIDYLEKRHGNRPKVASARPSQATSYRVRSANRQRAQQRPHPQPRPSSIPAIPLEFGMFSYYLGRVSYRQLIEALVWQRRQRPTLGVIAQKWGWLSDAKVAKIMGHRGHSLRFGKKAVELGYLKPHQVEALLHYQRSLQQRIGQYFIDKGLLTQAEADQVSQSLKTHNDQVSRRAQGCADIRR